MGVPMGAARPQPHRQGVNRTGGSPEVSKTASIHCRQRANVPYRVGSSVVPPVIVEGSLCRFSVDGNHLNSYALDVSKLTAVMAAWPPTRRFLTAEERGSEVDR